LFANPLYKPVVGRADIQEINASAIRLIDAEGLDTPLCGYAFQQTDKPDNPVQEGE
jgi:hypothetical protein